MKQLIHGSEFILRRGMTYTFETAADNDIGLSDLLVKEMNGSDKPVQYRIVTTGNAKVIAYHTTIDGLNVIRTIVGYRFCTDNDQLKVFPDKLTGIPTIIDMDRVVGVEGILTAYPDPKARTFRDTFDWDSVADHSDHLSEMDNGHHLFD